MKSDVTQQIESKYCMSIQESAQHRAKARMDSIQGCHPKICNRRSALKSAIPPTKASTPGQLIIYKVLLWIMPCKI